MRGYCGLSFEKREGLSNIFDNNLGFPDRFNVFKKYDNTSGAGDGLRRRDGPITVFEDHLEFEFKCGLETEVQM